MCVVSGCKRFIGLQITDFLDNSLKSWLIHQPQLVSFKFRFLLFTCWNLFTFTIRIFAKDTVVSDSVRAIVHARNLFIHSIYNLYTPYLKIHVRAVLLLYGQLKDLCLQLNASRSANAAVNRLSPHDRSSLVSAWHRCISRIFNSESYNQWMNNYRAG